ncbi:Bgt-50905 [Blumeria graminis f. sp. tritici]|uniref:Bgt-50905 n=1 Tax=Blumeria graminis f. sp. tritici TaxID=62690 RepID=A0A9X9QGP1_BLUGR|nr:Bgt-50905 [Blumeria graminis f. sp. tritici]
MESSPENHRKTFLELTSCHFRYLVISEQIIQKELKKRRYRHEAHLKPPVTQKL